VHNTDRRKAHRTSHITHHTSRTTHHRTQAEPPRAEREREAHDYEAGSERKPQGEMNWAAALHKVCTTAQPQAAQFLFFLGGFFFSFIKKRKSRNHST